MIEHTGSSLAAFSMNAVQIFDVTVVSDTSLARARRVIVHTWVVGSTKKKKQTVFQKARRHAATARKFVVNFCCCCFFVFEVCLFVCLFFWHQPVAKMSDRKQSPNARMYFLYR
jgi:hypothetical protein